MFTIDCPLTTQLWQLCQKLREIGPNIRVSHLQRPERVSPPSLKGLRWFLGRRRGNRGRRIDWRRLPIRMGRSLLPFGCPVTLVLACTTVYEA
ncbi:hypothetical protein BDZ89DRAFT_150053 [Hymenopellis radicata]|nr:hypothetical protein BDZ89DRAFT_150053 [Hymenopellis radicata]